MSRFTLAAACAAVLVLSGCGGAEDSPNAAPTPTPTASSPATTAPPAPKPSAASSAAVEQAFVMEVMGQRPELALARAELITAGRTTCQAFRDKPGPVADLVKNMKAAGQSADNIETARVIAVAAIHNLCPDQSGDL